MTKLSRLASEMGRICKYPISPREVSRLLMLLMVLLAVQRTHQRQQQMEDAGHRSNCNCSESPTKRLLQEADPVGVFADLNQAEDQDNSAIPTNRTAHFRLPEMSEQIVEPIRGPVQSTSSEQQLSSSSDYEPNAGQEDDEGDRDSHRASNQWFPRNLTRAHREEARRKHKKFLQKKRRRQHERRRRPENAIIGQDQDRDAITVSPLMATNSVDLPVATRNKKHQEEKTTNGTRLGPADDKWAPINATILHSRPGGSWKPSPVLPTSGGGSTINLSNGGSGGSLLPYNLPRPNGVKLIRLSDFIPFATRLGQNRKSLNPLSPTITQLPATSNNRTHLNDLQASAHSQDIRTIPSYDILSSHLRHRWSPQQQQPPSPITTAQLLSVFGRPHTNALSNRQLSGPELSSRNLMTPMQSVASRSDILMALENGLINHQQDSSGSQLPSQSEVLHQSPGELADFGGLSPLSHHYSMMPAAQQQQHPAQLSQANLEATAAEVSNSAEQLLSTAMKQLSGVQSLDSIQSLIDTNLAQSLDGALRGLKNMESKNKQSTSLLDQPQQNQNQHQQQQQQLNQISQKQLTDLIGLIATQQQQQQQQQQQNQQQQQPLASFAQTQMPMPMTAAQSQLNDILANQRLANMYNGSPQTSLVAAYPRPAAPQAPPTAYAPGQQTAHHHPHQTSKEHGNAEGSSMYEFPDGTGPSSGKRRKSKRSKSSPRGPQIRMQKRPRGGGASKQQQMHEIESQQDLQPAQTFHKYKYRPDDDDEEEGETELNIRFFNNFSRMGPLGGLARAGGTATIIMSLAFLILSNFSLAATVIAHGIAGILRNLGQSPDRTKLIGAQRGAKQLARPVDENHGNKSSDSITEKLTQRLDDRIREFSKKWI